MHLAWQDGCARDRIMGAVAAVAAAVRAVWVDDVAGIMKPPTLIATILQRARLH